ncbi:MAG: hypothetical protein RJA99_1692 [Pseudomonadota bacterium]|jgi:hypothetical protein
MTPDPTVVLGAAASPAPRPSGAGPRRLLVAGAVGRLGETLLNDALARGGYDEVVALADGDASMSFGVRGLALAPLDALPPLDDVCIAQTLDPDAPGARSFHGRDAPFALVDPPSMPRIAAAAAAAGARRLVLVHPLPAWQQMSGLHLGLSGEAELEMARLPFDAVTVLRPVAPSGSAGGGLVQRIVGVYLSVQRLMMPQSVPTLTSAQVARVAVDALRGGGSGVTVLGAAQIEARLGPASSTGR